MEQFIEKTFSPIMAYKVDMSDETKIPSMIYLSDDIDLLNMTVTTHKGDVEEFNDGDYLVYEYETDSFYPIDGDVFEYLYKQVDKM